MSIFSEKTGQVDRVQPPLVLNGRSISPGLSQGLTHIHHSLTGPIDIPNLLGKDGVEGELSRLDTATNRICDDLLILASRVERQIDARLAEVFAAHQLMVSDHVLRDELRREITENLVSASSAVRIVFLRWEKRFLMMESQIARDKGNDIHDISIRLMNALAGITVHALETIPENCVLVTTRLLPSDAVFLSGRSIAAILLEYGSSSSHGALFARMMGLPAIAGIQELFNSVPDNTWVLVDADRGSVTIQPNADDKASFQRKMEVRRKAHRVARKRAQRPAVTRDGTPISVFANVGCKEDTERAMHNGADGIGLYRTEHMYLGRSGPPGKDELVHEMRDTLTAAKGRSICVRLLDIGADKQLPFMGIMAETNPALGRRGIRLLLEYSDLLTTQLAAILELSTEFDICILIPMVALPEDVILVRQGLARLGMRMKLPRLPLLGAMIETPAAALSARVIAVNVDFMSFGTNDLTQYVFAADRDNAATDGYFIDTSDVIFRLLRIVHDDVPAMPLSLCGELAGRTEYISEILQTGVRALSVAPALVPEVKQAIRELETVGHSKAHYH